MNPLATRLLRFNSTACVISLLIFLLRLYSRLVLVRNPGWDDFLSFLAFSIVLTHSSLDINQINYGSGQSLKVLPPEMIGRFLGGVETAMLIYVLGTTLTRLSVCAFLPRLLNDPKHKKLLWAFTCFLLIICVFSFCFILFQCRPVRGLWHRTDPGVKCINPLLQTKILVLHGSFGVAFDVILLGTPIWIIVRTMLNRKTAAKVSLVFCVAALSIIASLVRLPYVANFNPNSDITITSWPCAFWSDIEVHTGFWASCLPAIQPIIRMAATKMGLNSRTRTDRSGRNAYRRTPGKITDQTLTGGMSSQEKIISQNEHEMGNLSFITKTTEIDQTDNIIAAPPPAFKQDTWNKV